MLTSLTCSGSMSGEEMPGVLDFAVLKVKFEAVVEAEIRRKI